MKLNIKLMRFTALFALIVVLIWGSNSTHVEADTSTDPLASEARAETQAHLNQINELTRKLNEKSDKLIDEFYNQRKEFINGKTRTPPTPYSSKYFELLKQHKLQVYKLENERTSKLIQSRNADLPSATTSLKKSVNSNEGSNGPLESQGLSFGATQAGPADTKPIAFEGKPLNFSQPETQLIFSTTALSPSAPAIELKLTLNPANSGRWSLSFFNEPKSKTQFAHSNVQGTLSVVQLGKGKNSSKHYLLDGDSNAIKTLQNILPNQTGISWTQLISTKKQKVVYFNTTLTRITLQGNVANLQTTKSTQAPKPTQDSVMHFK